MCLDKPSSKCGWRSVLKNQVDSERGKIPELKGIRATGKTLEECCRRLSEVIEGWTIVGLERGLSIPPVEKYRTKEHKELRASG